MYHLKKPILCIVSGVAGSGKSTIGVEIAKKLNNSVFLSKDLIQNPFTDTERMGDTYEYISLPTFKILLDFSDSQLSHNKIPIIDAPFSFNHNRDNMSKDWVSHFKEISDKHETRLAIIRCLPPSEEELKKRLLERGYKWDKWKLNNWEEFKKREPMNFPIPHDDVYELITIESADILSDKILIEYLKAERIIEDRDNLL